MTAQVNTAKVAGRRTLRFANIDEAFQEIDYIVAADKAGRLRTLGNWTPGQILGHVAAWIEYGYDGYPVKPPPWFIRIILRMLVKKYLRRGMPAGVKIPGAKEGTYGTEVLPLREATERLRRAFLRLKSGEPAPYDSPAFGVMSHAERIELNLRHAELHLSFLTY
jgi:hypothetical protein